MRIRVGYELIYSFEQPTPMLLTLSIHYSRASDILITDHLTTDPFVPVSTYRDGFGNLCSRIVAPAGRIKIKTTGLVNDTGRLDAFVPDAQQIAVENLPEDTLIFLRGSRYCETDLLSNVAWQLFGWSQRGWPLVQAICDYVHNHISFDYQMARSTRTAWEAYNEKTGVCRDFAHLAVTFCRALNIPARYAFGYLPDIGVPVAPEPMDFAGWMEVFLDGEWWTFDPRNDQRRLGRALVARGRDALDVAMISTYGGPELTAMTVWADEVTARQD